MKKEGFHILHFTTFYTPHFITNKLLVVYFITFICMSTNFIHNIKQHKPAINYKETALLNSKILITLKRERKDLFK